VVDPFGDEVTDAQREAAFAQNMLGEGNSPYNNGTQAICCMRQPTNTLDALLGLAVAAARPHLVRDGLSDMIRCANSAEVIPLLRGAAEAGRNSDPVLVERLARLAFERRLVTFDGAPGVYIQGVQLDRLSTPDGALVPPDWFSLGRAAPATDSTDAGHRSQRLVFEVPAGQGIRVGDLVDNATGQRVDSGADLADLVKLAVYLRTSAAGVVADTVEPLSSVAPLVATSCDEIRAGWRDFQQQAQSPSGLAQDRGTR
jgi:hypothetical protein